MKPNIFSEADSLKLINEMISQAKNNIEVGAANAMIRSGYTAIAISILNVVLLCTLSDPTMSFWIWLLMIPSSLIGSMLDKRRNKKLAVKTHIDTIISRAWAIFGWSVSLFLIAVFAMGAVLQTWNLTVLIMPVILILTGLTEYITGIACRYKLFVRGAYVFGTGSMACVLLLFAIGGYYVYGQFVILIICMIYGFCIPGHILNKKAKEQQNV